MLNSRTSSAYYTLVEKKRIEEREAYEEKQKKLASPIIKDCKDFLKKRSLKDSTQDNNNG